MDSENELKKAELNDDEIEVVSGGSFTSKEHARVDYIIDQMKIAHENGQLDRNTLCIAYAVFGKMIDDPDHAYTAEDFLNKLKKKLEE